MLGYDGSLSAGLDEAMGVLAMVFGGKAERRAETTPAFFDPASLAKSFRRKSICRTGNCKKKIIIIRRRTLAQASSLQLFWYTKAAMGTDYRREERK
jgi:hypothetical protein